MFHSLKYFCNNHSPTGFAPFELMHGRSHKLPMHLISPPGDDKDYETAMEYVEELRTGLRVSRLQLRTRSLPVSRNRSTTNMLTHTRLALGIPCRYIA